MSSMSFRAKAAAAAVVLTVFVSLGASPALAGPSDVGPLLGHWKNMDPHTRGWTRVKILPSNGSIDFRYWGACSPVDCGPFDAIVPPATVLKFQTNDGFATRTWKVWFNQWEHLVVRVDTHFTDGSGRSDYRIKEPFRLKKKISLP